MQNVSIMRNYFVLSFNHVTITNDLCPMCSIFYLGCTALFSLNRILKKQIFSKCICYQLVDTHETQNCKTAIKVIQTIEILKSPIQRLVNFNIQKIWVNMIFQNFITPPITLCFKYLQRLTLFVKILSIYFTSIRQKS